MRFQRKTNEEFLREVKEQRGNEYTVLEPYINSKTKILFRHNSPECNYNEFMMKPNCFLSQHQGCPVCSYKKLGKMLHTPEIEAKAYYNRNIARSEEEKAKTSEKCRKIQLDIWSKRNEKQKQMILEASKPYRMTKGERNVNLKERAKNIKKSLEQKNIKNLESEE